MAAPPVMSGRGLRCQSSMAITVAYGYRPGEEVRDRRGEHPEHRHRGHADHRGADPLQRSLHPGQAFDALQHGQQREHERKGGQVDGRDGHHRPPEGADSIAHERRQDEGWSRRELAQSQTVQELLRCEPVQVMDDLLLDKRQNSQASPKGKGPNLEEEEPHVPETWAGGVLKTADTGARDGRHGTPCTPPLDGTVECEDDQCSDDAPGARAVQGDPCGTCQEYGGHEAQRCEAYGQGTGECDEDVCPLAHRNPA